METTTIGPRSEIVVYTEGVVFVAVFDGDVDAPMVDEYARVQCDFAEGAGGSIVGVSIARGGSPFVSDETRRAAVRSMVEAKKYIQAAAVVLEAPGMLGSIFRSVVTGILMIAPTPYPVRNFATGADAEQWLTVTAGLDAASKASLARLLRAASASTTPD